MTLHAYMPALVAALLTLPLILSRTSITIKEAQGGGSWPPTSAPSLPESLGPAAQALLSSVDFFSLWTLVLLIIGYRDRGEGLDGRRRGRGAGRSGPSTSPSRSAWRRFSS